MCNKKLFFTLLPIALFLTLPLFSQGTKEDYKRSFNAHCTYSANEMQNNPEAIAWDGKRLFHYMERGTNGPSYYIGTVRDALHAKAIVRPVNQKAIASLIAQKTGKKRAADALWVKDFKVADSATETVSFEFMGKIWLIANACSESPRFKKADSPPPKARGNGWCQAAIHQPLSHKNYWGVTNDERQGHPSFSPNRKRKAYIRDNNVCISQANGKNERFLTRDGTLSSYYSTGIAWSPDGRYVAVNKIRQPARKRSVYFVQSSPDSQLQPILHQLEYAKPGDELAAKHPHIIDTRSGRVVCPPTDLFPNAFFIGGLEWSSDSRTLRFIYNQRGHQVYRYIGVDAESGRVQVLFEEKSPTFIVYTRIFRHLLSDDTHMLWTSERDNWNHLYLFNIRTGRQVRQITRGGWSVRNVLKVDEKNRTIFFTASGANPGEDPYHVHYYKTDFEGKSLVCLTPEEGSHTAVFNSDFSLMIDRCSTISRPPVTRLRSTVNAPAGKQLLAKADISLLLAKGWRAPVSFEAPGRDGKTLMWGKIVFPTRFDPSKKYPVLEYIYAGPGDAYTPKTFLPCDWNMTRMAELGFIVVQLDAMGTAYRGKKFEDVCYKNLKDAGFPDRILWIKAAAKKYPAIDISRVGIYGCSAGGQSALAAVLHHPEFYKAAFSACGCHDNRMDKIWWNEQWMGYPVDKSYEESSNVFHAHKLSRPLMLLVGEMDDNVDPSSTFQVVNALIRADKPFELVVVPNGGHGFGGAYGDHKRADFFVKNLMGIDPPAWKDL